MSLFTSRETSLCDGSPQRVIMACGAHRWETVRELVAPDARVLLEPYCPACGEPGREDGDLSSAGLLEVPVVVW